MLIKINVFNKQISVLWLTLVPVSLNLLQKRRFPLLLVIEIQTCCRPLYSVLTQTVKDLVLACDESKMKIPGWPRQRIGMNFCILFTSIYMRVRPST